MAQAVRATLPPLFPLSYHSFSLVLQKEESSSFYQRFDYKLFLPKVDWTTVGALWDVTPAIQELNVQSVVLDPAEGDMPGAGPYTIRGFAIGGGGRQIVRVDVSIDGGKTWVRTKNMKKSVANEVFEGLCDDSRPAGGKVWPDAALLGVGHVVVPRGIAAIAVHHHLQGLYDMNLDKKR